MHLFGDAVEVISCVSVVSGPGFVADVEQKRETEPVTSTMTDVEKEEQDDWKYVRVFSGTLELVRTHGVTMAGPVYMQFT